MEDAALTIRWRAAGIGDSELDKNTVYLNRPNWQVLFCLCHSTELSAISQFFSGCMLQLKPFDRWPDVVCLPPGAVDIQDLADWAAAERLATADEVMDMLTGKAAPALETAPPAPVVVPAGVVPASNGPAKPVDRGWVMKKAALIKKHTHQWNTIEADFHGASENGLSKAARTDVKGQWFEADALNWARQRGKLTEENQQGPATLATAWKTTKHSSDD